MSEPKDPTPHAPASSTAIVERVFSITDVEHSLEVVDENSTTFHSSHLYSLRAEVANRFFSVSYTWTGTDHTDLIELITDHDMWGHAKQRIHGPVIREGRSRTVVVDLGRKLERDETATVHFRRHLRDFKQTFQPFLGHNGAPVMRKLTLSVILPPALAEKVTYRELTKDTGHDLEIEELKGEPHREGKLIFTKQVDPSHPNRHFRICWGHLA